MSICKAILYAILITAVSMVLLTVIHGLPTKNQLIEGGTSMFVVAFIVMKYFGGKTTKQQDTSQPDEHDKKWDELNKQGRCGKCGGKFSEGNPDCGGGMCPFCWAHNGVITKQQ